MSGLWRIPALSCLLWACASSSENEQRLPGRTESSVVKDATATHRRSAKVSPELWAVFEGERRGERAATSDDPVFGPARPSLRDGLVAVDCAAAGDPQLLASALEELGMEDTAIFKRVVSGMLPITAIASLADLEGLRFARAAVARTHRAGRVDDKRPPQPQP
jgi:hypothetical protein